MVTQHLQQTLQTFKCVSRLSCQASACVIPTNTVDEACKSKAVWSCRGQVLCHTRGLVAQTCQLQRDTPTPPALLAQVVLQDTPSLPPNLLLPAMQLNPCPLLACPRPTAWLFRIPTLLQQQYSPSTLTSCCSMSMSSANTSMSASCTKRGRSRSYSS